MRHDWRDTKPAWSLLYVIVLVQTGLLAVIEVSTPPGPFRTALESVVVVIAFGLMLLWRRVNRARFDVESDRRALRGAKE